MMISYNRSDYDSASQWLEALRKDNAWLSQLQQLQNAAPEELCKHHQIANKRIEEGASGDFWYFYKHQVEKVVEELWETGRSGPELPPRRASFSPPARSPGHR